MPPAGSGAAAAKAKRETDRGRGRSKVPEETLLNDYSLGDEIGQGAFGVVYACTLRSTGLLRAVKMVDKAATPVEDIRREAEILADVCDPTIIKFHEVYYERCFVSIVMDRLAGGDLLRGMQRHWDASGMIPPEAIKHIEWQCIKALAVLHSKDIVHRDIKGDNYLQDRPDILDTGCRILLTDFGTARRCGPDDVIKGAVGTRTYWSPEVYADKYGQKMDVWAFGVVQYGLLKGRFPFKDQDAVMTKWPRLNACPEHPDQILEFLKVLLHKEAKVRPSAATALEHPWLASEHAKRAKAEAKAMIIKEEEDVVSTSASAETASATVAATDEVEPTSGAAPGTEGGEAADGEVPRREGRSKAVDRERRYELVERLEGAAKEEAEGTHLRFLEPSWEVANRHVPKVVTFEWMSVERAAAEGLKVSGSGRLLGRAEAEAANEGGGCFSSALVGESAIDTALKAHGVETARFGKGEAKSLKQFVAEIQGGTTKLMLDAEEYRTMVRLCDLVVLRISCRLAAGPPLYLIEIGERFPDGRKRMGLNRLPGTKKEPHENVRMVAARICTELLGMGGGELSLDFKKSEVLEEVSFSKSYPGVRSVYRKTVVEGTVAPKYLASKAFAARELQFEFEDATKNTKYFKWMAEEECISSMVPNFQHDHSGPRHTSCLVVAPIAVDVHALQTYLAANGIDTSKFGQSNARSLEEFAGELSNSESRLAMDRSGHLVRMVDVVTLRLIKEDTRELLVQSKEVYPCGRTDTKSLLPGSKKLMQENQFQAAYRILDRLLHIDENYVNLNTSKVRILEEGKESSSYPGIKTIYSKRIIDGEVVCNLNGGSEATRRACAETT